MRHAELGAGTIVRCLHNPPVWDLEIRFSAGVEARTWTNLHAAERLAVPGWRPTRDVVVVDGSALAHPCAEGALDRLSARYDIIVPRAVLREGRSPAARRHACPLPEEAADESKPFLEVVKALSPAGTVYALTQDDIALARLDRMGIDAVRIFPGGQVRPVSLLSWDEDLRRARRALSGLRAQLAPIACVTGAAIDGAGGLPEIPPEQLVVLLDELGSRLDGLKSAREWLPAAVAELHRGDVLGAACIARHGLRPGLHEAEPARAQLHWVLAVCDAMHGRWEAFAQDVERFLDGSGSPQLAYASVLLYVVERLRIGEEGRHAADMLGERVAAWCEEVLRRDKAAKTRDAGRRARAEAEEREERDKEARARAQRGERERAERALREREDSVLAHMAPDRRERWRERFTLAKQGHPEIDERCRHLFARREAPHLPSPPQPAHRRRPVVVGITAGASSTRGSRWSDRYIVVERSEPYEPPPVQYAPLDEAEDLLLDLWLHLHPDGR